MRIGIAPRNRQIWLVPDLIFVNCPAVTCGKVVDEGSKCGGVSRWSGNGRFWITRPRWRIDQNGDQLQIGIGCERFDNGVRLIPIISALLWFNLIPAEE